MSAQMQMQKQAKTPAALLPGRAVQNPVPEQEADRPDLDTQLENAACLGHSLETFKVGSGAPATIQTMPLIQRQENPEEEKDEEELQMQREPASIQRQEKPEEEEEELQMIHDDQRVGIEGGKVPAPVETAINHARGGGQPLDDTIQAQMGEKLGHDFSNVRVHTDTEADLLNQQVSARAFTTGRDIFFRLGEYSPGSENGQELLAHELSHVVQQSTGQVHGDGSGMTVRPAGDVFEKEAESKATYGVKDLHQRQMSEAQILGDYPALKPMEKQPSGIDINNGRVAQRHCWEMSDQAKASFKGGRFGHSTNGNNQFWRLQSGLDDYTGSYFAPDEGGKAISIAGKGIITKKDRDELAVLPSWSGRTGWQYMFVYTVSSRLPPYEGIAGPQKQGSEECAGGARQVVFPTTRDVTEGRAGVARDAKVRAIGKVEDKSF